MEFTFKTHKITKTKVYIKKNSLFFLFSGVHQNSINWIFIEQSLTAMGLNYWKICSRIARKALDKSICRAVKPLMNGITFAMDSPMSWVSKLLIATFFEALFFKMLAIKLNHKFYRVVQIKNNYSFHYKDNKVLIFHYRIADLKKKSK